MIMKCDVCDKFSHNVSQVTAVVTKRRQTKCDKAVTLWVQSQCK